MGYGIARGQKIKMDGIKGIEIHVFRKRGSRSNPDIDYERTKDNIALLVPALMNDCSLSDCVNDRIKKLSRTTKAGKTRKMKSDAVVLYDFILTGTHEDMMNLTKEERMDFFKSAVMHFLKKFGAENVMYAVIHMDEKTPHMHLGLVPEFEGTLCAKKLFTPQSLIELQDELYEKVFSRFGMNRGERGSEKKHLTTMELKSRTLAKANATAAEIVSSASEQAKKKENEVAELAAAVEGFKNGHAALKKINPKPKKPIFGGGQYYELDAPEYRTLRRLAEDGANAAAGIVALKKEKEKLQEDLDREISRRRKAELDLDEVKEQLKKEKKQSAAVFADALPFLEASDAMKNEFRERAAAEKEKEKKQREQQTIQHTKKGER